MLPDCGAEDEIRRTEQLAAEQDELDNMYPDDDWRDDLSPEEVQEMERERYALEDRIEDGTYDFQDAERAGFEKIPAELIFAPEGGLQVEPCYGTDPTIGYDEEAREVIYAALLVSAVPVNQFGDTATKAGPMVGLRISLTIDDDPREEDYERAAVIVLPQNDAQAREITEFAKNLVSSPDPKVEDAAVLIEDVKWHALFLGAQTHELMPRFPLNVEAGRRR